MSLQTIESWFQVSVTSRALIETGLHRHHGVVIIGLYNYHYYYSLSLLHLGLYNCPLWVISHLAAISAG